MPSSLLQVVNSLFQTSSNKHGTSSANTTCEQPCYNLFADLQQLVRFYARSQLYWLVATTDLQLVHKLSISSCCKSAKIRLVVADFPYNFVKQLAANLWKASWTINLQQVCWQLATETDLQSFLQLKRFSRVKLRQKL